MLFILLHCIVCKTAFSFSRVEQDIAAAVCGALLLQYRLCGI